MHFKMLNSCLYLNKFFSLQLNKPANSGLNLENSLTKKVHPTTTAVPSSISSLSLNTTIGGDGLRGDQVAPAASSSPLNHSSLNSEISAAPGIDKELSDTLFGDDDHDMPCFDALHELHELPDLSKDLIFGIDGTDTNCFDEILTNGIDNPLMMEPVNPDKDLLDHLLPDTKELPKVKETNLHKKGLSNSSNSLKKCEKKIKLGGDTDCKSTKEKPPKEKHDKSTKPNVKSKKYSDAVKLKPKENVTSSKSVNNSSKIDSKVLKSDKLVGEKKSSKPKKISLKSTMNGSTLTPTKSSDGENEEIDVVTVSNDKPFSSRTDSLVNENKLPKSGEASKNISAKSSNNATHKIKHSLAKTVNGLKEPSNGKMSPSVSPKNGLTIEGITLDCNSKPDELVVKIPLALLKRIPFLKGSDFAVSI
jgi:hypothetical protein